MQATVQLVRQLGGEIAGLGFAIELDFLKGRDQIPRVRRLQPAALRRINSCNLTNENAVSKKAHS